MSNDTVLVVEKGTIHAAALLKWDMLRKSALCVCLSAQNSVTQDVTDLGQRSE